MQCIYNGEPDAAKATIKDAAMTIFLLYKMPKVKWVQEDDKIQRQAAAKANCVMFDL